MELSSAQLQALPAKIRDGLYRGYSDVLNQMDLGSLRQIKFAAKTTAEGEILVSHDGGSTYVSGGSITEFPQLLKAMRQVCDASRIQFPAAFRKEEPIAPLAEFANEQGSSTAEIRGIGLDVNSVVRNGCAASGVLSPFVAFSGFAAGTVGIQAAIQNFQEAKRKYVDASTVGDREGKIQAALGITSASFYELASWGMVGAFLPSAYDQLVGFADFPLDIGTGYGEFADGCAIAMSLAIAGAAIHEWGYVSEFRNDLGTILGRDLSEREKAIQGLEFLQQQIALSTEDWGDLSDAGLAENAGAISNKCREKQAKFVRRVGTDVAAKVAQSADLLKQLKAGSPEALQEAKELIELAELETFKKRVKEITCLAISVLMITAAVLSLTAIGGNASSLLYMINAVCWLTIDSSYFHNSIGKTIHRWLKAADEKRWIPESAAETSDVA